MFRRDREAPVPGEQGLVTRETWRGQSLIMLGFRTAKNSGGGGDNWEHPPHRSMVSVDDRTERKHFLVLKAGFRVKRKKGTEKR